MLILQHCQGFCAHKTSLFFVVDVMTFIGGMVLFAHDVTVTITVPTVTTQRESV